jgi:hypothetical protein
MFVPAWAMRLAPYIGGAFLAGVVALWLYGKGIDAERAKWRVEGAEAAQKAREREDALQDQVDAAGLALSMSTAELERLSNAERVTTRNYYVQNPAANVACLTPDRLRSISESDTAAYVAATASK